MAKATKQGTTTGRTPPNAGKGRPKGSVNKTTASVKAAITEAFDNLGGVPSLVTWGKGNPDAFYGLWGRLAPAEVHTNVKGAITVSVRIAREGRRTTAG